MAFISVFPGFTAESGFGLTGNIGDGNSVTITGSGFGTKPNGAAPLFFIEFGEGSGVLDSLSRDSVWSLSWDAEHDLGATDEVAPNRSSSMRWALQMNGDGLAGGVGNQNTPFNFEAAQIEAKRDMYMFLRLRFNANAADMDTGLVIDNWNLKSCRFRETDRVNNCFAPAPVVGSANGEGRAQIENVDNPNVTDFIGSPEKEVFGLQKNKWVTDEWEMHSSDVDTTNGTWKISRNGLTHLVDVGGPGTDVVMTRNTAHPEIFEELFLYQEQRCGDPGFQIYCWHDLFFADDSLCHIIISEEATWDSATASPEVLYEREPQIPTAWADTSITCKLRQGVHSSLSGKYLYVINSAGTAQKIGQFT